MTDLYRDRIERVHNRVTEVNDELVTAAVMDDINGPLIRVGDHDLFVGQARVLLAQLTSAVAHLDYCVVTREVR